MVKRVNVLALAAMEKLIKKAGAERVSEDAKEALKNILQEIGIELSKKSVELAKHSKRKTVKAADINLANKK